MPEEIELSINVRREPVEKNTPIEKVVTKLTIYWGATKHVDGHLTILMNVGGQDYQVDYHELTEMLEIVGRYWSG